jgi:hypothetical protein
MKIRSPFYKETPENVISKIADLKLRLKSMQLPYTYNLTDDSFFQKLGLQLGWASIAKIYETQTINGQLLAYNFCPIVTSVISKRNDAFRNGRWSIEDAKGVEKKNSGFARLFERPNPMQSWRAFISQAYTFHDIFGRCYILPVVPAGFDNLKSSGAMWVIPNWLVIPNYTRKIYGQTRADQIISGYRINGISETIPVNKMIVWDDTPVRVMEGQEYQVEAQSRLYPLGDQITNFQTAYASRKTLLEKRGALGAWVNNNPIDVGSRNPQTPKERAKILEEFAETYGIDRGKYPFVFTTSSLKWEQAGYPTKELMLFEEVADDAQVIADAFNVSIFLLPWADQTTYTNLEKAEKKLYTNVTIPDANDLAQVLSSAFGLIDEGSFLKVYFDHLEVFQKNKKEEADALSSLTSALDKPYGKKVISKLEYRILLSNFMPQGAVFDPEKINGDEFYDGSPTQTIVAQ